MFILIVIKLYIARESSESSSTQVDSDSTACYCFICNVCCRLHSYIVTNECECDMQGSNETSQKYEKANVKFFAENFCCRMQII